MDKLTNIKRSSYGIKEFTITEDHLKLLPRLSWIYDDSCYEGAPAVDLKRPYGNSGPLENDIAPLIGVIRLETDSDSVWPKGTHNHCMALHYAMRIVLEIGCSVGKFEAGKYINTDGFGNAWKKV